MITEEMLAERDRRLEVAIDNLMRLIRAVNNHARLIAHLEELIECGQEWLDGEGDASRTAVSMAEAQATLAAMKGEGS